MADKQENNNNQEEKLLLPLPKWKFWYVMVILYALYFLDFATRAVVSPMFPVLKAELGLSDTQLGWLSTIVLAMVGLLSIPLSYFIDRWRRGRMLSLMSIIWSIASFFSGLSVNFTQLLVTRGILGVGEASFNSGGQALIMAMVKKARRATVTGIWTTATSLGMAFGMVIGGWVAVNMGWRMAFMVVAIPGIIFGILAWFMPDYKNRPKDPNGAASSSSMSFGSTMKAILTNKTAVMLFISFGLLYYFLNTIVYWLPTYFNRYMGMDVTTAGSLTAVVMISALIASPLGGWLGDLISRKNPANKMLLSWICVSLSIICYACAILFNAWPLFFVVTF
ncbi:MAG: MFS transporter, partial [Dehalococcoidia bacterium]